MHLTITGIIFVIVLGQVIGALGRLVVPGRQPIPIWLTIVIGIIAAWIGDLIAEELRPPADDGADAETEKPDRVTHDILVGQTAQLEQLHWFGRAHLEKPDGTLRTSAGRRSSR
jgi:uncharacterized membrane protein YeaQ/YmgE (transglycosylase-associated protein family)